VRYAEADKERILTAYTERSSLRGLERTFGLARQTVAHWLEKVATLPSVSATLHRARPDDVLELDDLWSFVENKATPRWTSTAQGRRTRQIVA
jgi:hypothetical protein